MSTQTPLQNASHAKICCSSKLLGSILCLLLLLPVVPAYTTQGSILKFYVFSDSSCPTCVEAVKNLEMEFQEALIVIYDLYPFEKSKFERFENISLIIESRYNVPLVGVLKSNSLAAITSGPFSGKTWRNIVEAEYDGVPVFVKDPADESKLEPLKIIRDQQEISLLTELFTEGDAGKDNSQKNVLSLLPLVVTAAAVDAVNPCEFSVFAILLTFVLFKVGKKAVLKTGLAFTLAIFIMYFLMGLGLIRGFAYVPQIKYVIIIFAFAVGALHIIEFLGKEIKRVPDVFARMISSRLEKALNPKTAFIAGTITALLLLPCTSGPYFIVLNLLSEKASLFEGLLLLIVYHAIIITPFLIITLGVHTLTLTTGGLKKWSLKNRKWINLLSGVIMLLLSLFLFLS